MDTVLPGFVTIFVMLFGIMSLTTTLFSTQDAVRLASQEMQTRLDARARTSLLPVSATITGGGMNALFVFRNQGVTKLTDFPQWDVIVQYMDNNTSSGYHIDWRGYTIGVPFNSTWAVNGIFLNTAKAIPAAYDPGILDPGEELAIQLKFSPPIGNGKVALVTLATANGVTVSSQGRRNMAPVLLNNIGATISISTPTPTPTGTATPTSTPAPTSTATPTSTAVTITTKQLNTTDVDNTPDMLLYTITTLPTKGTLSLDTTALIIGSTFTQADINNGRLNYTPISAGSDNFQFTVTNGDSVIGPDSFGLVITNP